MITNVIWHITKVEHGLLWLTNGLSIVSTLEKYDYKNLEKCSVSMKTLNFLVQISAQWTNTKFTDQWWVFTISKQQLIATSSMHGEKWIYIIEYNSVAITFELP